jgi:hypothetical protein
MVDSSPLDNLRPGADVISSDKKELGKLHATVMDPRFIHILISNEELERLEVFHAPPESQ